MTETTHPLLPKLQQLVDLLDTYGKMGIAYSGGVDSTFLAAVCAKYFKDQSILLHVATPFVGTPERESLARELAPLDLPFYEIEANPLEDATITSNPEDRCYHCKKLLFTNLCNRAQKLGCNTVLEGSNADDALDYRPGARAVQELNVASPLTQTNWHKNEEREVLRIWGYSVWNMPEGACLATRFYTHQTITQQKVDSVRACEDYLRELGLSQVRMRITADVMVLTASVPDLKLLIEKGFATYEKEHAPSYGEPCAFLSPELLGALKERGAFNLSPVALVYQHGASNIKSF